MTERDVFLADCPARTTLDLIANTWSVVVIAGLGRGPARFNDLRELIGGISKKMLVETLRRLERNGPVARRTISSAPAGVEYRLTPLGESLLEPVRVLSRWAQDNADDFVSAQDAQLVG